MEKKLILIVDDEPALLSSMSFTLKRKGYAVTIAREGREALDLLEKSNDERLFDLVITDIQLPEMTGPELMTEIRNRKIDVPVMVITAYANYAMDKENIRTCACLLHKPFSSGELLDKVSRVLAGERFPLPQNQSGI